MKSENFYQPNFRTFLLIWSTQVLSMLGSEMTDFAITLWAWNITGQATSLSLIIFFNQLPRLITTLFAGIIVDRYNRKLLMILGDAASGISTIIIFLLYLTNHLEIWHIYASAVILGPFRHLQYFAFSTSISLVVPKQHYTRAVVMSEHIGQFSSNIIAPSLAGGFYYLIGLQGILSFDIVTFILAIATICIVHIPQPVPSEIDVKKVKIWQDLTFGLRYIIQSNGLLNLLLFLFVFHSIDSILFGIHSSFLLARSGSNPTVFASIQSVIGLGGLVGALWLSIWGGFKRRIHGLLLGIILHYSIMMVFSLANLPSIWMITGFLSSVFWVWISSSNQVIWLSKVPPNLQGRVFATRYLFTLIASPLGLLIAGPLADNFFRPAMMPEGILAPIFGSLFGNSSSSGMALQYTLFSFLGVLLGFAGYTWRSLRNVERIVPDYDAGEC
ncbi:major facilitator superfamily MFS_1 [Tolypothrix tenuis PCC 7101]|uniref:Major facilitator superfamily MFS_1 n=1 Tax=Tolypothrix tenuis PCC 7101 TaxID=231146 RepID=A0A1Z4N1T6_9CYAN|nr:MFS transporter [Aulosira sp. FACHB-113]BAY99581.1 major facilitator superfamily MFS_1 [Tolypothrix tenuis PCC 7101]BAZ76497.1 major facilitator superfamily MFS_1 [Aulosira laxa NIES-50]